MTLTDITAIPRGPSKIYDFSEPFWEATKNKKFVIQRCRESGQAQFYPRPVSIATGRNTVEWEEIDGKGSLYTYSVMCMGFGELRKSAPYLVGVVRLDAGADILANIVNCDIEAVKIGMRLRPYWMPIEDGRHLLMFEPDPD